MQRLMEQALVVARCQADILVQAESGTGKEVLARFIHQNSPRKGRPFVAVNCAAFPADLLENELFGHNRGAFTGADAARQGKFELAAGGTLLLDEIGELPLPLQPKLLRVLQEREVDRLGGTRPVKVDVRVIATTNKPLADMVAEGRFRNDLYYRLNVIPLSLPPLRERMEDVEELVKHFIAKHATSHSGTNRNAPQPSNDFLQKLFTHSWPGNIRELENVVRRSLVLSNGDLLDAGILELPAAMNGHGNGNGNSGQLLQKHGITLRESQKKLLMETLQSTHGNRTRAAQILGVSVRTVRNKVKEFGLPPRWIREEEQTQPSTSSELQMQGAL